MANALELRDYTFRYAGSDRDVLSGCCLSVGYGEFVCLSGESGAGKSTLLGALIGSIPHIHPGERSGQALIGGREASEDRVSARARLVGSVLQDAALQIVHAHVEDEIAFGCENLGFPPDDIERRVALACEQMKLGRRAPTGTLSGGQKQRLITAATLAMGQRAIILDEPLANLDAAGARFLLGTLRDLARQGCAILLAEHRLDAVAPFADRILWLSGGACREAKEMPIIPAAPHPRPSASAAPPPRPSASAAPPPILEARSVSFSVPGKDILRELSFSVGRGERVVLLGENGCGKTTLLRVLARLARPTSGEVVQHIDARLGKRASPKWFSKVGYVYQNPNCQLFMPSVLDEIAYKAESLPEARRFAEMFDLSDALARHPHSLSEGQKRKLSVAAVCATRPDVLLLDEPTVGQDSASLSRMIAALDALNKERGMAIVTVTHDRRCAAALADRTVVMKDGQARGC